MTESDWKEEEQIGQGGQGTTFLVTDQSGMKGVKKVLIQSTNKRARARMHREVSALKSLASLDARVPSILDSNTHEFENKDEKLYFVMEFIPGPTLKDYVKENHPLSIDTALDIAESMLETIETGISEEYLHRDLKPENIILKNGSPKQVYIVDYGLSFNSREDLEDDLTAVDERMDNRFLSLAERRVTGGNRRDPRSDLTSISGVLYYALTNEYPVDLVGDDGNPPHRRRSGLTGHRPGESWLNATMSLLDRAFKPNIEERIQAPDDLRQRLQFLRKRIAVRDEDSETLAEVVQQGAAKLKRFNRPTQLRDFVNSSSAVWNKAVAALPKRLGKTSPFDISVGNASINAKEIEYEELLPSLSLQTVIKYANENVQGFAQYFCVASGPEVLVLKRTFVRDGRVHPPQDSGGKAWEIGWTYDGIAGPSADFQDELLDDVERAIKVQIQDVVDALTDN